MMRVADIQRFCMHDGPGVRTTVFFKGCPLSCAWCHNPETQSAKAELLFYRNKCIGCTACAVCENEVHVFADAHRLDRERCIACGTCVSACPTGALELCGSEYDADTLLQLVQKDRAFFGASGGVTLSGGEPLMQSETVAFLKLCKEHGISTAVETCGAVSWETMAPVLENTDIVLYDIKQMDSALHKQYTGVGNERILENLQNISEKTNCTIIVRCPVIPPCNDSAENFHALGRFLTEKKIRVSEINLLPYHNMGEGKREQLEPGTEGFTSHTPTKEEMEAHRDILRGYGFIVK